MAVQASQDHFIQASSCRSFHKSLLSQSQDVHKKKIKSWLDGPHGIKKGNYRKTKSCVFYTNAYQWEADYGKSELLVNLLVPE